MNSLITPDASREFKSLLKENNAEDAIRALALLQHTATHGISPLSTPYQVTEGGEVIHVISKGKIRIFFTVTDQDTMVVLGVTSKPSVFDPKGRLEDYLHGDR